MIKLRFSIYEHSRDDEKLHTSAFASSQTSLSHGQVHNVLWVFPSETDLPLGEVGAGQALYVNENQRPQALENISHALRFEVCATDKVNSNITGCRLLSSETFDWPDEEAIFRLDQVTFPSGAIAYRHIHSGAGFRHLVLGGLHIDTGSHIQQMHPRDSWFEDMHSPVRATAMEGTTSQFIRAMLIPVEFQGKPTIKILDPIDAAKPSLQKNHRFIDQPISL